jgi:hypothetical protein
MALAERAMSLPPHDATEAFDEATTALRKLGSSRMLNSLYNGGSYSAIKAGIPEVARKYLAHRSHWPMSSGTPPASPSCGATSASRRSSVTMSTGQNGRLSSSFESAGRPS